MGKKKGILKGVVIPAEQTGNRIPEHLEAWMLEESERDSSCY